jgi:sigma-B regulation protein RsbU (phosphoserine phosphatase)
MLLEAEYVDDSCDVSASSSLYIFSDGIYEIHQPDGNIWGLDSFVKLLGECRVDSSCNLNSILEGVDALNPKDFFDDDLSLLEINFD